MVRKGCGVCVNCGAAVEYDVFEYKGAVVLSQGSFVVVVSE